MKLNALVITKTNIRQILTLGDVSLIKIGIRMIRFDENTRLMKWDGLLFSQFTHPLALPYIFPK